MSFCSNHPNSKSYKSSSGGGRDCQGCAYERRNKKRLIVSKVLGNSCVHCGSLENLEIDHIDPSTKNKKLLTPSGNWLSVIDLGVEEFKRELKLCQRLCRNCHIKKTLKDLEG